MKFLGVFFRKKRIFYFDELRALAILLVVLCHISILYRPFTYNTVAHSMPGFFYILTHVAVPLFFMLSGALLIGKDYSLSEFFKKRFSRVLIPAVFWYIILFFSVAYVNGFNFDLMYIWIYDAPVPWFVCAIIGVYLVMPIFSSFVKEYGKVLADVQDVPSNL